MYRPRHVRTPEPRRGIILLVVLAMLMLFTVVGISFVFFADAEAYSSRLYRESENLVVTQPGPWAAYFLSQLIYDVDDTNGVGSAMRGHSLLRTMFGWNDDKNATNNVPFNGTGRPRYTQPMGTTVAGMNDYDLINYIYQKTRDGFLRDPERYGVRADTSGAKGTYVGGFNPPYTYPDLNNMFLAAVQADGTLLMPSFFRPWAGSASAALGQPGGFGPIGTRDAMNNFVPNANWTNANPALSYLVLRPRNADHPNFPLPTDEGGDVQNLIGWSNPNTNIVNDSLWMDLGSPVQTLPDGRKYKMLFAPLIMDLDNRVNLNFHGNIRGGIGQPHVSNQGWGPWEVSLPQVLNLDPSEWQKIFLGANTSPNGRYGPDQQPNKAGTVGSAGPYPHSYAAGDFDACQDNTYAMSQGMQLPAGTSCFPTFPSSSFGDYSSFANLTKSKTFELTNNPLNYNLFQPGGDDRRFPTSEMASLLRYGDKGTELLTSDLLTLLPTNFINNGSQSARRRRLVTTDSYDPDSPGVTPWFWKGPMGTASYQLGMGATAPSGPALPFPPLPNSPSNGDFGSDWRDASSTTTTPITAGLGRLDLNRSLPDYPQPDATTGRITDTTSFNVAQQARQDFARDIFNRLIAVTGTPVGASNIPTDTNTGRWLAQLAVNMVDYIDTDDYSTPFNWDLGTGWVYGTEIPRVVLNEAYVEYAVNMANRNYQVWVELHNPMSADPTLSDNGAAKMEMPAAGAMNPIYPIYQVILTKPDTANLQSVSNVDGTPTAANILSTMSTYKPAAGMALPSPSVPYPAPPYNMMNPAPNPDPDPRFILASNGAASGAAASNRGFYLLGPNTTPTPAGSAGWPASTLQRDEMTYSTAAGAGVINPTIVLRRLACPLLPPQNNSALPLYNPYITVDYMENVTAYDSTVGMITARASMGRMQPYAGNSDPLFLQNQAPMPALVGQPQHTFFNANTPKKAAFDWLVHLDRQLISPMELLHVSAFKPHQLTQQFYVNQMGSAVGFQHYAPWFDQGVAAGNSARLYRFFEFLETKSMANGMATVQLSGQTAVNLPMAATSVSVQVTVGATSGTDNTGAPWSINVNDTLIVDSGANRENVRVTAVDSTTFTATFQRNHGNPFSVFLTRTANRLPGKININTIWDSETFSALCGADPNEPNGFTNDAAGAVQTTWSQFVKMRMQNWKADPNPLNNVPGNPGPSANDKPLGSLAAGTTNVGDTQYPGGLGINNTFLGSATGGDGTTPRMFEVPGAAHPYKKYQLMTKIFNNVTTRSNVFAVWCTVGFFQVTDADAAGNPLVPVQLGPELGAAQNQQVRHRMFAVIDRSVMSSNPGPQPNFDPKANPALVPYFSIID